jgi:anti-anti-sigma factor
LARWLGLAGNAERVEHPPRRKNDACGGTLPEQQGEKRMNVQSIQDGEVAIVRTDGYINNLGAERIEQECEALIQQGYRKFVINFAKSPIINSMGLSILIGIIEKTLEVSGVLAFTDLTPVNEETMEIMGLKQYARIYRTEEEARQSLTAAPV